MYLCLHMEAGDAAAFLFLERGHLTAAEVAGMGASGAEGTPCGRVYGAWDFPLQGDARFALSLHRVRNGNGAEQCDRVGVQGVHVDVVAVADFHDVAKIHHGDAV